MKMLILLFAVAIVSVASANNLKVEKIKTLGDMKHKVIFQSNDYSYNSAKNTVETVVVARWGTEVFEMATVTFKCDKNLTCKYSSYKRLDTFKSCVVVNDAVACERPLTGNSDYEGSAYDVVVYDNPDQVSDEYDNGREGYEEYPEFPERDNEEYKDIF